MITAKSFLAKEQKICVATFPANFMHSCVHEVAYDLIDEFRQEVCGKVSLKVLVGPLSGSRTPDSSPRQPKVPAKRQRSRSENPTSKGWITSGSSSPNSPANQSPRVRDSSEVVVPVDGLASTGNPIWDQFLDSLRSGAGDLSETCVSLCHVIQETKSVVPDSIIYALQFTLPRVLATQAGTEDSVEDSDSFSGLSELAIVPSSASSSIAKALVHVFELDRLRFKLESKFVLWLQTSASSGWRLSALKEVMVIALTVVGTSSATSPEQLGLAAELLKLVSYHSTTALEILHSAMVASKHHAFFFELGYVDALTSLSKTKNKRVFRSAVVKNLRELIVLGLVRLRPVNQDLLDLVIEFSLLAAQSPAPTTSPRSAIPVVNVDVDFDFDQRPSHTHSESLENSLSFSDGES